MAGSLKVVGLSFFLLACLTTGARVSLNTEEHQLLHEYAIYAEPSFRLAGVPIFNAMPQPHMRLAPGQPEPTREWIVMLKKNSTDGEVTSVCGGNSSCLQGYPTEGGFPFAEVSLSDRSLEAMLEQHPGRVAFVEADLPVSIIPEDREPEGEESEEDRDFNGSAPEAAGESFLESDYGRYPWGIMKVGADRVRGGGRGVNVYVLDTGIRISHQEFGGRAFAAIETYQGRLRECNKMDTRCASDQNGHGTHCAGTVGGATMGVASGATLWGVKVFGADGSTTASSVMSAMDWVKRRRPMNAPAIASMSLGGAGQSYSYKIAVDAMVQSGITVVVAAGNENDDACGFSPAFVPSAITVAATTPRNVRSSFSCYGRCTNIFAPGSGIQSASHTNDRGYVSLDGTSMATPHVAGAAARILESRRNWLANDVMKELQRTGQKNVVRDTRGSPNLLLHVR